MKKASFVTILIAAFIFIGSFAFVSNARIDNPRSGVVAREYDAGSIDGDDINSNLAGRSLTLTAGSPDTLDADSELYTKTFSINILGTSTPSVTLSPHPLFSFPPGENFTVTEVWCDTNAGTRTVHLEQRLQDALTSKGTDIITELACTTTTASTTTFVDATIPLYTRIYATSTVSGSPVNTYVHIRGTFDD